jgi:hypothetical protein
MAGVTPNGFLEGFKGTIQFLGDRGGGGNESRAIVLKRKITLMEAVVVDVITGKGKPVAATHGRGVSMLEETSESLGNKQHVLVAKVEGFQNRNNIVTEVSQGSNIVWRKGEEVDEGSNTGISKGAEDGMIRTGGSIETEDTQDMVKIRVRGRRDGDRSRCGIGRWRISNDVRRANSRGRRAPNIEAGVHHDDGRVVSV